MKKVIAALLSLVALQVVASPEWVNGEVVRVDQARNRIVLKHEYIPSIKMAPMTMPFGVVKEIPLDQYRPGDMVRFQIKVVDGALDITVMEKLK
jgi:Cu/Ag efflux protein CusF